MPNAKIADLFIDKVFWQIVAESVFGTIFISKFAVAVNVILWTVSMDGSLQEKLEPKKVILINHLLVDVFIWLYRFYIRFSNIEYLFYFIFF